MCSSTPSFDSSLVLKLSGSSSTSPSRLPRMFVEYQPDRPSMRALSIGASTVLISVWPVLKSLPEIGTFAVDGELAQHRRVDAEVRRAVGERHALEQRGVGVEHRRRDRRVVGVDRRLERLEVHVRRAGLDEDLGRRAPDHHDPVDLLLLAEAVDVLADRVEHRPLVDRGEHVVGVDVLDVRRGRRRPASGARRGARRRSARCACRPRARRPAGRRRRRRRGTGPTRRTRCRRGRRAARSP